jgi:hypothetical protein
MMVNVVGVLRTKEMERLARYRRNWAYYRNEQYSRPEYRRGLFRQIRHLFNQVTKIVDTDARFAMGQHLGVKVASGEEKAAQALDGAWRRSAMQQSKYLLARYGACCGDAFIKVVGGRDDVRLVVLPPDVVFPEYDPNDRGRMVSCRLEYAAAVQVHKEVWFEDRVEVYDPDSPQAIASVLENRLGVIPFVHIQNLDVGEEFGLCSFHNLLPTLDSLNEIASFLVEMARMYGDPVYVARGVQKGTLEKGMVSEGGRPVSTVWYVPVPDGGIEVLEWRADAMTPALAFMDRIQDSIREAFPELVLGLLKASPEASGYSLRLRLCELERKISEVRANYFAGLVRANELALRAMGFSDVEAHEIVADPILPADEEAQQRMLIRDVKDLGIKSRATAARQRGVQNVEAELAAVDAEREHVSVGE